MLQDVLQVVPKCQELKTLLGQIFQHILLVLDLDIVEFIIWTLQATVVFQQNSIGKSLISGDVDGKRLCCAHDVFQIQVRNTDGPLPKDMHMNFQVRFRSGSGGIDRRVQLSRRQSAVERRMYLHPNAFSLALIRTADLVNSEKLPTLSYARDERIAKTLAEASAVICRQQLDRIGRENRSIHAFEGILNADPH